MKPMNWFCSFVVIGGAVAKPDPESTGLNPAWRKALMHMFITIGWPDGSSTEAINEEIQEMIDRTKILDKLSVDSGSYINEVCISAFCFCLC